MAKGVTVGIEVSGAKALTKALKTLGQKNAPFLRLAFAVLGHQFATEVEHRAQGGIARTVAFAGVKGGGARVSAVVKVSHPGAASMEFGRTLYYEGYTDRHMKATGRKKRASRGQRPQPYMGVIRGDQAIGVMTPRAKAFLERAIEAEWDLITAAGDAGA